MALEAMRAIVADAGDEWKPVWRSGAMVGHFGDSYVVCGHGSLCGRVWRDHPPVVLPFPDDIGTPRQSLSKAAFRMHLCRSTVRC